MYCIINLSYSRGGKKNLWENFKNLSTTRRKAQSLCATKSRIFATICPSAIPAVRAKKWRANIWRTTSNTTAVAKGHHILPIRTTGGLVFYFLGFFSQNINDFIVLGYYQL